MLHFLIAFVLSFLATIPTIKLAQIFGLTTDVKKRFHPAHTHTGVIPRAGGLPILVSFLITTVIFIPIQKLIIPILLASILLVIVGLLDDKYDLSPYLRFFLNFVIACIAISGGLGIPYISNPFGQPISLMSPQIVFEFFGKHTIWVVADLIAILWLVSMMNITNWSKGVDGQLPGFVGIACIFLALITRKFSGYDIDAAHTRTLAMIVAGAFFGFLPWNFYPQKIMPGYGGGTLAGFLLGILTILSFGKVGTLLLVMSVPILDGFYAMLRRIHHGQNPFKGDAYHLHHLLLRRGWDRRVIAIFYMLVAVLCGGLSLILSNSLLKFIAIIIIYSTLFAWIYWLSKEDKKQ